MIRLRAFTALLAFAAAPALAQLKYADQVATGTSIALPNGGAAELNFNLGFSAPNGTRRYLRFEFTGATIGT
ncbi:MAG: hypothetical protein AAGE01_21350, partial [Pseudomonadota bacterium]